MLKVGVTNVGSLLRCKKGRFDLRRGINVRWECRKVRIHAFVKEFDKDIKLDKAHDGGNESCGPRDVS